MNKTIWCLYDDGFGSWNKMGFDNCLSIGINVNDWDNYVKIDLSLNNPNLIKELKKLPKPHAIIASPPCESWSIADNSRRAYRCVEGNKMELHTYEAIDYLNKNGVLKRNYWNQQSKRLLGESTALAVNKIIECFKPKIWIIENPKTSKIWEYMKVFGCPIIKNGIINNCYYNCYDNDNFTKKPTTFLSNINLNLRHFGVKSAKSWGNYNNGKSYDVNSSIPKELIMSIYGCL